MALDRTAQRQHPAAAIAAAAATNVVAGAAAEQPRACKAQPLISMAFVARSDATLAKHLSVLLQHAAALNKRWIIKT
jgi:hypothetical protein